MDDLTVEQLERARRRMLLGFLDGYAAWQIPQIVHGLHPGALPYYLAIVLPVMAVAGAIGFTYYGWQLLMIARRAGTEPAVGEALNDERVQSLRLRAMAFAFSVLIVYMGSVCLVELVQPVGGTGPLMQLGLVIAVSSAIGAYLWQEWRSERNLVE